MTLIYIQYPKRQTSITNRYLQIVCGDGKREAGEECDDTNLTPGDGCSVTCTIEADYICTGGTPTTADTCSLCTGGTSPDATKTSCTVQCGDSKLHATENCDDGNTGGGDGCTAVCDVEANYICTGGTTTNADTCSQCTGGTSPDATNSTCVATCGDSKLHATENCDDGNTAPGDGCTAACDVEADYICTGGTTTNADTCTQCTGGTSPDATNSTCIVTCGDSKLNAAENCDDGNTAPGDGCDATCDVEADYICTGGTTTNADTCTQCTGGTSPDATNSTCIVTCGDSKLNVAENCDDGNTAPGDGCDATCDVEAGYICTGGTVTNADTCTLCGPGLSPDATNSTCIVQCGDGRRGGAEICDDGNAASGDGCDATCTTIEANYICVGGTTTTQDTCTICPDGSSPNPSKTACIATCGDAKKNAAEECEDGNTADGDGCSSGCIIEANYVCSGGTLTSSDTCTLCTGGTSPNAAKDTCIANCGDGFLNASENCDDDNTTPGDGCDASCDVETGYICTGGSITAPDTCALCTAGTSPDATNSTCTVQCGDGRKHGSEACDDGNTANGDGCSSACVIEASYACAGGTTASADTCTLCNLGTSPDATSSSCTVQCGDGREHATEECEDGNTSSSDGCSSTCVIENGYVCSGGTTATPDTCTLCTGGLTQNAIKDSCIANCGDGLRHSSEECDDSNTAIGDGCDASCAIEYLWICIGGTLTTQDVCTQCINGESPNPAKTACLVQCGDGLKHTSENCDDGNTADGDGCSSACNIETNSVCVGGTLTNADTCTVCPGGESPDPTGAVCQVNCGDSFVHGSEACDDGNTLNSDGCSSTCTVEADGICNGGSLTTPSVCSKCTGGTSPNAGQTACVAVCGDGLNHSSEECDDSNTANGDGCSNTCTIEANSICYGSNPSTCTTCGGGTSPNAAKNSCVVTCGDGRKHSTENCEDGNTADGDGCSSICEVESGAFCSGGTVTTSDTCTICTGGTSLNAAGTACVVQCGDGKKHASEACDDGNSSNEDGCSSACLVEAGAFCTGGTTTSPDTCTQCTGGTTINLAGTACTVQCGDGKRHTSESCDDGNTANGDGCSATCTPEAGYICNGGTELVPDTCETCISGMIPNPDQSACVIECGDGFRNPAEQCDDNNIVAGDGCDSNCTIEYNYICNGGTNTTRDTCTKCPPGITPDPTNTVCQQNCGDGYRHPTEECDDGNTLANDGCSKTCTIEQWAVCDGGTLVTTDKCQYCTLGTTPNPAKTQCLVQCGDGREHATEECEDGNTANGDGCSSTCTIENMHACSGGTDVGQDTCVLCTLGTTPNPTKTACEVQCGDGLKHATEACEDSNIVDGDGCTSKCVIEPYSYCTGGSTVGADTCVVCTSGTSPNAAQTACAPLCGDSRKHPSEECDDGNTVDGDGCSSTCVIETKGICSGGTITNADTCAVCPDGYHSDPSKTYCRTICGDGFRAGLEQCDDGGNISGDGCNYDCMAEYNYICVGGSSTSKDSCSFCPKNTAPDYSRLNCISTLEEYDSSEANYFAYLLYALVIGHTIIHIAYNLRVCSTGQSCNAALSQTQLIMMLPEIGTYLPILTRRIIFLLREVLLSFNFLMIDSTPIYSMLEDWFGYTSNYSYENWSLVENGSPILNLVNFIGGVILFVIFFLIIFLIRIIVNPNERQDKWWGRVLKDICDFTFSFAYLVWIVKYTYLWMVIISFPEINDLGGNGNAFSKFTAFVIFLYTVIVLIFFIVIPFINASEGFIHTFYQGLELDKWQRFHIGLFFIRRFIFGSLVFFYNKKSMIYPYWATHTLYIAFIGKIRAYVNLKDKLVEIVNEIIYFILVSIMIFFEDRHDWTKFVKYVYLALVLSNLFMTFVIGIVAFSAIPSTSRKNKIPGLASGKGINSQFGKNNNSTAEKQNLTDANSSRYQSGRNDIVNLRTHKLDGSRKKHLEFTAHKKNDPTGVMKLARYDANALKK